MKCRKLIQFVSTRDEDNKMYVEAPLWQGYVFSVGLLLSQLVQTALFQQLWYLSVVGGFHVRAALISVIYKKVLLPTSFSTRVASIYIIRWCVNCKS